VHAELLVGLIAGYSDGLVAIEFVLGVVFAFLGFRASERYRRANGVTPWRWPSAVWAVLFFVSLLLGLVLYLIARSTTRPKAGPTDWAGGGPAPGGDQFGYGSSAPDGWNAPPPGGWGQAPPQGWDAPAPSGWGTPMPGEPPPPPPGGWDAPPPPGTAFPGFAAPGGPGAATDPAPPASGPPPPPPPPRSWLPDPGGHHELRYWDGAKFTEHVADGGKISVDPL
jgi:hypothetical protein